MPSSFPLNPGEVNRIESGGESKSHSVANGIAAPHSSRLASPIASGVWITVAWVVGMLVFEMTSLGEQRTHHWIVQPEANAELVTVHADSAAISPQLRN